MVQQAAQWLALLWSDEVAEADRLACQRWLASDPAHLLAWQRLQGFDGRLRQLPATLARDTLRLRAARPPTLAAEAPEPSAAASSGAPTAGLRGAGRRALLLAAAGGAVAAAAWRLPSADFWQRGLAAYRTGTGETRQLTLADGSEVVMAPGTALDLNVGALSRQLLLHTGEVLVTTSSPAPRTLSGEPLQVVSRDGLVEALGTRFSVRQFTQQSRVAVYRGAVRLRPAQATHLQLRLDAGKARDFSMREVGPPEPVAESALAWIDGRLIADAMPLADLLAELGRYRQGLLRCDPAIAGLQVSGIFSLRDTERALDHLARALPVEVLRRSRFWVTVRPRTTGSATT